MKLQELINETNLDMTPIQVEAFLLGTILAEKPLPFSKAFDELLCETPEAREVLEVEVKRIWSELQNKTVIGMKEVLPDHKELPTFIEVTKDQLDYFLTGMSLSGTNCETCKNEHLALLLEELEDYVEDLEDFLEDEEAMKEEGLEFKDEIFKTWGRLISFVEKSKH